MGTGGLLPGPHGLAVDANGDAYFAAAANTGFAVTSGAYQTTCASNCAVVVKLNPAASAPLYATYLGQGSAANAVAIDASTAASVVPGAM